MADERIRDDPINQRPDVESSSRAINRTNQPLAHNLLKGGNPTQPPFGTRIR